MARAKPPNAPSMSAQKEAFRQATDGRGRSAVTVTDAQMSDLELLDSWLLAGHQNAARIAHKTPGRPAEWAMMRAAICWLVDHGECLSDATGSRCVRSLGRFLKDWRARPDVTGKSRGDPSAETARDLAGKLIEMARTISIFPPPVASEGDG